MNPSITSKNSLILVSKSLFKSTIISGSMTFLSRLFGFVRDIVIAKFFGASIATDAFFVAFKIPNFLRRLFAEGAFSQAFVPVLSEYKITKGPQETKLLIDHVAGALFVVLFLLTLIAIIFAPIIIMVFAPGYIDAADGRFEMTSTMLRITFPYLLLISITAFCGAILNTYRQFAVPAFAPVLLNISMIVSVLWLIDYVPKPIYALAVGVSLGGVAQLVFMWPFVKKLGLVPKLRFKRNHQGVRKIIHLIVPALFGVSVSQINLLLDTVIASFLTAKSISWLYYADRLLEFPLGVFGVALATVVLPSLSSDFAKKDTAEFTRKLDWSLRLVCLFIIPAAIGLFWLAEPALATLFGYGQFTAKDSLMSAWALKMYAFGLFAFILIKVLANGYFSRQDTKTPVKIGIIAMVSNMVLNGIFVGLMWHYDFIALHAGLALATTVSGFINAGLLYRGLAKSGVYRFNRSWFGMLVKISFAGLGMLIFLWWACPEMSFWHAMSAQSRVWQFIWLIAGAVVIYFALLRVFGLKFWQMLK